MTNLTLRNVSTDCPVCGGRAELPDGTFDVIDETIHVVSASGLTRARLLRLAAILEDAQAGELSDADAAQALVSEAPKLAPLIKRYAPIMKTALVAFLAAVFHVLLAQGVSELRDDSATKADVERAVRQVIEQCRKGAP